MNNDTDAREEPPRGRAAFLIDDGGFFRRGDTLTCPNLEPGRHDELFDYKQEWPGAVYTFEEEWQVYTREALLRGDKLAGVLVRLRGLDGCERVVPLHWCHPCGEARKRMEAVWAASKDRARQRKEAQDVPRR